MDVTRDTFEAAIDALEAAVADPHFAFWSFDCEFTGLNAGAHTVFDLLDTPEERFRKVHACVRAFAVLQYGVCTFHFDPRSRRWTARPFNFWLFPDHRALPDASAFGCQASSLSFLANNGFDFNKCIREGVPYVPASERARAEARRDRNRDRPPIVPSNDRDRGVVAALIAVVTAWLKLTDESDDAHGELVLEPTNAFLRALTYQTLEKDVFGSDDPPGFIAMTRRDFPDGVARISLKRATPSEVRREKEAYEAAKKREEALSEGFTLALRTLARSGAPAVGHNAMFDVVFTMDKFLAAEPGGLDGTYRGFKASLASALAGALYDTKLIAAGFAPVIAAVAGESGASVDTGLGPLYERLTRASVPKMLSSGNNNNAQATTVIDIKTKNGNGNENGKGKAKAVGGGKKNETKAKTKTKTKNARADAAGACAPFRRSGESVLDWIAFPESFTRYDAALHANASGDVDDDDDATDGGGGCMAFAHEAGYDAFMTGVCFLTMTVHGRALVDADGDGWISIFHGDGDAEAEAEAVAARPPLSRTSVGLLGNVPFAAADGAVPTQRSDLSRMQLIGPDPPPPDRSGVLFLTDVAPRTSVGTIAQRFAAAGLAVPLQVVFIGRGVCRVVTSKSDGGAAAAREKLRAIGLGAEMLTLEEYRARQAMDRATAAAATAALAAAEARALAEEAAGVAAGGGGGGGGGGAGAKRKREDGGERRTRARTVAESCVVM